MEEVIRTSTTNFQSTILEADHSQDGGLDQAKRLLFFTAPLPDATLPPGWYLPTAG